MPSPEEQANASPHERSKQFVHAMSGLFESLGRALVCLDGEFRVVHASEGLDAIAGPGASAGVTARAADEVFGSDLFGPQSSLRHALEAGERREGWGASLNLPGRSPRMLSLSAAPVHMSDSPLCDPRVSYILVLRAIEDDSAFDATRFAMFSGMVGRSAPMRRIFELVQNLSESEATVLLTGESGTGKELVARALHHTSPRHARRFVGVNCGALPG